MNPIRRSPFMDPLYSLLMAIAALLGLAAFLNLKEKEEKISGKELPDQRSILQFDTFNNNYRKIRFGFIIVLFLLLFLNEEEE